MPRGWRVATVHTDETDLSLQEKETSAVVQRLVASHLNDPEAQVLVCVKPCLSLFDCGLIFITDFKQTTSQFRGVHVLS